MHGFGNGFLVLVLVLVSGSLVLGLVWFGFLSNWMLLVLDLFLYIFLFPNLPLKI